MICLLTIAGVLSFLKTAVIFIVVLGALIFFHELGHYLAAKRFDIYVQEFALGFGPKIWSRQKGETLHSLRALPLGGFCKMAGENPGEDFAEEDILVKEAFAEGRCFYQKSPYKRFMVIAMGPIMNIFLALLIFILVFAFWGIPIGAAQTTLIGDVIPGYPAAEAGLRPGDSIVAINGRGVDSWEEMSALIRANPDLEIELKVQRRGQLLTLAMTPQANEAGYGEIGIYPAPVYEKISLGEAFKYGVIQTWGVSVAIVKGYYQIITRQAPAEIGGVVKIAQMVGDAAQVGAAYLMSFAAFISINLAIINLLPIPALDGGRLFFLLAEIVTGKAIDPEKEGMVHFIGFIILLVLIGIVLINDIRQIF